jgi:hypothetical protein
MLLAVAGQYSDIPATSPEGINLDVIGYDLTPDSQTNLGNISTRSFCSNRRTLDDWVVYCSRQWDKESDHSCHWP